MTVLFAGTLAYHDLQDNDIPIAELTHRERIEEAALTDSIEAAPRVFWVSAKFDVSAYCPCERCCAGFADGFTASGISVWKHRYFVAADRDFSFGTVFIIPGYANGDPVPCIDRGGKIKGTRLDVCFANPHLTMKQNHQAALNFGRREITVKYWRRSNGR